MLRIFKYLLLIPAVVLLGFIVAEKLDLAGTAHHIMGMDAAAVGAVPNPDWESINPIGCRYRFNLGPGEFARLQQEQLPQESGWMKKNPDDKLYFPGISEIRTPDAEVYVNTDLPYRVRWVVYNPKAELLYLGFYSH